jgi:hypothetical protein
MIAYPVKANTSELENLKILAEQGKAEAQFELGTIFYQKKTFRKL